MSLKGTFSKQLIIQLKLKLITFRAIQPSQPDKMATLSNSCFLLNLMLIVYMELQGSHLLKLT